MKRILILIMCLVLSMSFACKRGQKAQEETKQEVAQAENSSAQDVGSADTAQVPPAEREGRTLTPDEFFKFEFERLKLNREYQKRFIKLLDRTKSLSPEFEAEKNALIQEFTGEMGKLNKKYDIIYADLKTTYDNPSARQAFQDYQKNHPEVKKQMEDLYAELQKLTDKINSEWERLNPAQGGTGNLGGQKN